MCRREAIYVRIQDSDSQKWSYRRDIDRGASIGAFKPKTSHTNFTRKWGCRNWNTKDKSER